MVPVRIVHNKSTKQKQSESTENSQIQGGASSSSTPKSPTSPDHDRDLPLMMLALETLGSFPLPDLILLGFCRAHVLPFLTDRDSNLRRQAAITCTWCSSAKRENISLFLIYLLRGLTRVTYTTNKSHPCHSLVSLTLATIPLECYGNTYLCASRSNTGTRLLLRPNIPVPSRSVSSALVVPHVTSDFSRNCP